MRALGPGSVSSLLKVILDVVFHALWVIVALMTFLALACVAVAAFPGLIASLGPNVTADIRPGQAAAAAFELSTGVLYTLGVLIIIGRLRRLFASLTAGDPFHPDNVRRLRVIAIVLGSLEIGRYAAAVVGALVNIRPQVGGGFSLTPWFAVLVVVVLSEVFREGARLRREAELTI